MKVSRFFDLTVKKPIMFVIGKVNDWWKDKHKLRFKSYLANFAVSTPVVAASRIRPKWRTAQTGDRPKFHDCPGMLDFANSGYIVTAHCDIHIKANEVGGNFMVSSMPVTKEEMGRLCAAPFDFRVVDGFAPIEDDVKKQAHKIPLPWSVHFPAGYSAYVLPAIAHSEFLDKIFVYPGVVHYDKYHTLNFVFSALKECDFIIKAGEPLLHLIPFKREEFVAVCGRATQEERDEHLHAMPSRKTPRYYRRFLANHKLSKMECPYDHRDHRGN